ncbi:MAG: hypothetical protein Q8M98_10895 [Candidatus Cloacimonadaceae bacterium]|nr:hypothetical protein [Candidatus Cloacimonadaceae bacterium]MDP3115262.1 hypothetical protein [Candidatus Cloacimonadaceae bacterium]
MIAIPVEIDAMLAILNLPKEMGDNGIFKEHRTLVLEMIRSIVLPDSYTRAIQEDMPEDDPFLVSFRFGFCFLMLHSTVEFLNLKTLGEGIVKTVGLDQSATELLTGSEIDAFKANLELRALTGLLDYLNLQGLNRLDEMKPRPPRVIRVGVI